MCSDCVPPGVAASVWTLQVDYLVEGNVRRADQRFKVGIRLTKTSDGFQIWSDDFDAATAALPSLHDRIAREVAGRIGSRLTTAQLSLPRRAPPTKERRLCRHAVRTISSEGR